MSTWTLKKLQTIAISTLMGAAVTAALITGPAEAANSVLLKPSTAVTGQTVKLSDMFRGITAEQDAEVFEAPQPGENITLFGNQVADIAELNGIEWKPRSGRSNITISRLSRPLSKDVLHLAVADAISAKVMDFEVEVELDRGLPGLYVAAGTPMVAAVEDVAYSPRTGRFSAIVQPGEPGHGSEPKRVQGRAFPMVEMPVFSHHLMSGRVVKKEDIVWKRVRTQANTIRVISDPQDLIGKITRRPIAAGQLIRRTDVKADIVVQKKDLVTITLKTRYMTLNARGVALERGAKGDVIAILNKDSKRTVEAIVTGRGTAVVIANQLASLN